MFLYWRLNFFFEKLSEVKAAEKISYPRAIELIKEAFHEVSPEMADFAQMMMDKKWIDCNDAWNILLVTLDIKRLGK